MLHRDNGESQKKAEDTERSAQVCKVLSDTSVPSVWGRPQSSAASGAAEGQLCLTSLLPGSMPQDRQATREAVTTAIDASAAISRRAMELKEQNYHARREERAEMLGRTFGKPPDKKKDTFNTKVLAHPPMPCPRGGSLQLRLPMSRPA